MEGGLSLSLSSFVRGNITRLLFDQINFVNCSPLWKIDAVRSFLLAQLYQFILDAEKSKADKTNNADSMDE